MEKEREASQVKQYNRYNNFTMVCERGITPEKNIVIKNIMPSPFAKKISLVQEKKNVFFEQPRHGRQFSYQNSCYTRPGYSPYQLNNGVINTFKYVKY